MFTQISIICALAVVASALSPGYVSSPYALGSQAEHTIRGYGGLSSYTKQAKAVDSPYSTVRKTDIRVTNDAAYAAPATVTYAHHGHPAFATPAFAHHGYATGPATISHHGYTTAPGSTISHHGYAAAPGSTISHHGGYHVPSITYSHHGFASPTTTLSHGPIGYQRGQTISSAPSTTTTVTKQVVAAAAAPSGLGISYSPATSVAHATFSGYGVHYGY